jgi:hypothetical protein
MRTGSWDVLLGYFLKLQKAEIRTLMPAKDSIHDAVKTALIKDGWTITDDPLTLDYRGVQVFVDLAPSV